jgi:pimeloyl-ACP methyl ester carboxylesterase
MKEGVVLLHGILRTKRCMQGLADFLNNNNYQTLNLGYDSSKHDILTICNIMHPEILAFSNKVAKINYIGYSLGGLVIRAYLNKYRPNNLNRVVMIGTPNKGSEIADFLQDFWFYKFLFGPASQQLITNQSAFKAIFGNTYYELGIIAGESRFNFIASHIIGETNDGRVSIRNTMIEGMKNHVIIKSRHRVITSQKEAWKLALGFLQKGSFNNIKNI